MSIGTTLVSYRAISEALHKDESVIAKTEQEAEAAMQDPVETAAMMAGLGEALKKLEEEEKDPEVLVSVNHRIASLMQTYLARQANKYGRIEMTSSGLKEVKFDGHDWLGWAGSLFDWIKGLKKHKWLKVPQTIDPIDKDVFRVALLGDWGTGLYGALVSASTIQNDPQGYDMLIHLGDVYYSGDVDEVIERFHEFWPKNPNAISRAINSNHEMYSGGKGYFDVTLKRFGQSSSCFALQNAHWVFIGMDSAYANPNHGSLTKDQVPWIENILSQSGDRKVVLFSHHQGLSSLDKLDNEVASALGKIVKDKHVFAWYWGHEHRCVLYDLHPAWNLFGRCVGHSGYPYFRDKLDHLPYDTNTPVPAWRKLEAKNLNPGCLVLDAPNPHIADHPERYGAQGHMTLEFNGPSLNEIVHYPDGTIIYERQLA